MWIKTKEGRCKTLAAIPLPKGNAESPYKRLETCRTLRSKAVTAVHRTIRLRLERYFRILPALRTDDMEHLTLAAVTLITAAAALVATVAAACRLVLEPLLRIELLLA